MSHTQTTEWTGGKTGGRTDRLTRFLWSRGATGMRTSCKHAGTVEWHAGTRHLPAGTMSD